MGNVVDSFAENIITKQKEVQIEMQNRMADNAFRMMCKSQDRSRRMMAAQQVALSRDLVWWFGGFLVLFGSGVAAVTIKQKRFPKAAALPLFALSVIVAYHADFAYGKKSDRIHRIEQKILKNKKYWFVPVEIDEKDLK